MQLPRSPRNNFAIVAGMDDSTLLSAIGLSLRLGAMTACLLAPLAIFLARHLALSKARGRFLLEALILMPLVLPPVVLGFYFLLLFGAQTWLGQMYQQLFGHTLAFSFGGLLLASLFVNLPFAVQPIQRSFSAIPTSLHEAAWVNGLSPWKTFVRLEWPLVWPGILAAMVLVFAHTLGEFGVVLMLGGNIPGVTQTLSIALYDSVQALDLQHAHLLSGILLGVALIAMSLTFWLQYVLGQKRFHQTQTVRSKS